MSTSNNNTESHAASTGAPAAITWYNDHHLTTIELNPDGLCSIDVLMNWLTAPSNFSVWRGERGSKITKPTLLTSILKEFKNLGITTRDTAAIRSKINRIIKAYRVAETWRNQTGQGLLNSASNDTESVCKKKYEEIAPFFFDTAASEARPFNEDKNYENVKNIMFNNNTNDEDELAPIEMVNDNDGEAAVSDLVVPSDGSVATSVDTSVPPSIGTSTTSDGPTASADPNKRKRSASNSIIDAVLESSDIADALSEKRPRTHERKVDVRIAKDLADQQWRQQIQAAMANLGLLITHKLITKEEYFAEVNKLD
ncbi:uncharacterized protein EV154DRAFT_571753 [Mucor mucedo]|uniref:uncharacterized protein n=1 Tax=Mucor mucedo TaxID=29922 RepID=UPI00221F156F|nr:uncharacterized protein EV154DRAFT_571753 [Mucor mucedo]KAI7867221.1 hypothetical protein EV154DRAFT_571753 [Mucor mucedo]